MALRQRRADGGLRLQCGYVAGDEVTTTVAYEAYYSGFEGYPVVWFEPGDVGKVAPILPSAGRDQWLVVDFYKASAPRRHEGTPPNAPLQPWRVRLPASAVKSL